MDTITTETILESISDGVFTIDRSWRITSFNKAAERITGLSREDAIGLRCSEVFKSNMCEGKCPLAETFATGKPIINQNGYIVNLAGKRAPVSVSTALLKNKEGEVIGGVETFRDLSEIEQLRKLRARNRFGDIETNSEAMRSVLTMVPAVAQSSSTVLILGESGTGKEVLARTIHSCSTQKKGPFIAVNCGALPDTLLESELFGYHKGAFTGATQDKLGRFALARGGTLFLDEIGDISMAMQVKLLRVLQEKQFEPLGSQETEKTDARIMCATNRDLEALVEQGKFRKDLYYRIHIIAMTIPPLRERKEDIPLLADQFLKRYNMLNNKNIAGFSSAVYAQFYAYMWPGNIRELENVVERAVVLCQTEQITVADIPFEVAHAAPLEETEKVPTTTVSIMREAKESTEREYIIQALQRNGRRVAEAAKELGMHRSTLYRKMEALDIDVDML
ncbi:MAG: sigma 54-interacting transcriptional regulator [Sphaerochaetaceae bacterium]|jgi:PAS domain S-box-containing protein|nr:sigma 54-interacting transcriptional regulator [Sphaerochaetaceae bacterium]MDD4219123.1 sigma 54-interacting transcriptional regulator [Sphaerochaetaceae bacterium]